MAKTAKQDKTKQDKTKKGMTHPTLGQHRGAFRDKVWNVGVTETEDALLTTFRLLEKARKSRAAYTRWAAWEMLKSEVAAQNDGIAPALIDVEANPALYAAVTAIRAYLGSEQARTKAGAKKARKAAKQTEGSRDNG